MGNFSTKMVSLVSVAALTATTLGASVASAASEFLPYAETLADNDVISAQSTEAGYRLGDTVTRAELAKVTANLGGYTPTDCAGNVYGDVTSKLGDLCGYIEALADAGVVSTANANFRPAAPVTRAEMVKMLLGAVGETGSDTDAGYMDVAGLGDLAGYINRANELGVAATSSYFRPNATASRGEAFKIAAGVAYPNETETPSNTGSTSTGVVGGGSLTVALDGAAAAQYVPKNASSVKVGAVKLIAGDKDVNVTSITITRSGLGRVADIKSIQLAQSGSVVSDARTLNQTSQSAIVRLNSTLTLKAGTSVVYDVLVSLDSAAESNSQHQFAATAVNGNASSVAGLPVTLGLINTTSYSAGVVTVASVTTASSVTAGKTAQRIVNVKIDAASNRDTTVYGFTLSKDTGEDYTKAFANPAVYRNGVKVGTVSMTTDKLYVTGLNTTLLAGESADYELRADTIYVGTSTTTTFKVNETTDVSAIETTTGYATAVGALPGTQSLTLNGVQVTWNKSSTGSQTVAPGASSIVLFDGKVTSDASFDVTNYTLTANSPVGFDATAAAASFSRLVLNVDGIETDLLTVTNPASVTLSASSDKFRVEPGKTVSVKVTGTLKSNAVAASYRFTVNLVTAKNVTNGNTVTLNASQQGDTVSVMNGKATFKAATIAAPSTKKITANASMSELGRFAILGEAEDITVRKLVLTNANDANGSATLSADEIADLTQLISGNSVKLYDIDTGLQITASITVVAGSITADSMSLVIPKDVTKNIKVVADTTSLTSIPVGQSKFTLRVAAPAAGDITRQSTGNATLAGSVYATGNATGEFVAASSTYTAGKVVPTVTVAKASNDLDRYTVTVRNLDPESAMDVVAVTIKATPGFLNGTTAVTWDGEMCVRNGATGNCNVAGVSTAAQNVATSAGAKFTLAGTIPNLNLVKNTGTVSFEVYAPNMPYFNAGGMTFAVTALDYDSIVDEDYTGISSAKVAVTK